MKYEAACDWRTIPLNMQVYRENRKFIKSWLLHLLTIICIHSDNFKIGEFSVRSSLRWTLNNSERACMRKSKANFSIRASLYWALIRIAKSFCARLFMLSVHAKWAHHFEQTMRWGGNMGEENGNRQSLWFTAISLPANLWMIRAIIKCKRKRGEESALPILMI